MIFFKKIENRLEHLELDQEDTHEIVESSQKIQKDLRKIMFDRENMTNDAT